MDAGTVWKSPGIFCGEDPAGADVYCPTASQICCAQGDPGNRSFECVAGGIAACAVGTAIRCDDRTDCPSGQVCCGFFSQNAGYRGVACQTSCNSSPIPNTTTVRFCDPNAPHDECAEIGKVCTPSGSLSGYDVCK